MMTFFTRFNPRPCDGIIVSSPSRVQKQFADATKTDNILKKYSALGMNPFAQPGVGEYFDCTVVGDLRESLEQKQKVDEYFQSLPASIRREFDNDSLLFAEEILSGENTEKFVKMGILPESALKTVETPKSEGLPSENPAVVPNSPETVGTADSAGV